MTKSIKTFLNESISYRYYLPKDREQQMYDFYVWSTIYQGMNKAKTYEYSDMYSHLDDDDLLDLNSILNEAIVIITKQQKKDLLEAILIALLSEIRHLTRFNENHILVKHISKLGVMKEFAQLFDLGHEESPVKLKGPSKKDLQASTVPRQRMVNAFKHMKWPAYSFVNFCERMFYGTPEIKWDYQYGGKAWANIATGWKILDRANSVETMIQAIDHIYDLEHNNGTVLNKTKDFAKDNNYTWIKLGLDLKYTADLRHIATKSSIPQRILGLYNRLTGMSLFSSYEAFEKAKIVVQDIKYPGGKRKRLYGYETDNPHDKFAGATPEGYEKAFPIGKSKVIPLHRIDSKSKINKAVEIQDSTIKTSFINPTQISGSEIESCYISIVRSISKANVKNVTLFGNTYVVISTVINDNETKLQNGQYPTLSAPSVLIKDTSIIESKIHFVGRNNFELNETYIYKSKIMNLNAKKSTIRDSTANNSSLKFLVMQRSTVLNSNIVGDTTRGIELHLIKCKISNVNCNVFDIVSQNKLYGSGSSYDPQPKIVLENLTIKNTKEFENVIKEYLHIRLGGNKPDSGVEVTGSGKIASTAKVTNSTVSGNAKVLENAVCDNVKILDWATVSGFAEINHSKITDSAKIIGHTHISYSDIGGNSTVEDSASVNISHVGYNVVGGKVGSGTIRIAGNSSIRNKSTIFAYKSLTLYSTVSDKCILSSHNKDSFAIDSELYDSSGSDFELTKVFADKSNFNNTTLIGNPNLSMTVTDSTISSCTIAMPQIRIQHCDIKHVYFTASEVRTFFNKINKNHLMTSRQVLLRKTINGTSEFEAALMKLYSEITESKITEALSVLNPHFIKIRTQKDLINFVENKLQPKISLLGSLQGQSKKSNLIEELIVEIDDMIRQINKIDSNLLEETYGIREL